VKLRGLRRRIKRWWNTITPRRYPHLADLVTAFSDPERAPAVVGFGDSVWERVSRDDLDRRTLAQMLAEILRDRGVSTHFVHGSGYNQLVFLGFVRVLASLRAKPAAAIIAVNLRSFSPQWQFNPLWRADAERRALARYLSSRRTPRFLPPAFPSARDVVEYDATRVSYPGTSYTTIGDFRRIVAARPDGEDARAERMRVLFRFHYMHPLVASNDHLVALSETLRTLQTLGVRTLCYITPVNVMAGNRHLGADFERIVSKNVDVIHSLIQQSAADVELVDLSRAFPSGLFFHDDEATEHLNEAGRTRLAMEVANRVSRLNLQK
jgi:hypothetical protein